MHTDIEQRLRSDAAEIRSEAPRRVRHAVLDAIRDEAPAATTRSGWRWPAVGFAATLAVAVTIGMLQAPSQTTPDAPAVATTEPVESEPVAEEQPGAMDAMLVAREAALAAEMDRVRRDLERIRGLVKSA